MVAVIPLVIAGVIGLILLSRAGDLFKSADRRAEEDRKGALGAGVDDALGEGASMKGGVPIAVDAALGQGAFAAINNAGATVTLAGYNFASDPFNQRPDLTLSQLRGVQAGIAAGGGDPSAISYEEIHDIVDPDGARSVRRGASINRQPGRRGT